MGAKIKAKIHINSNASAKEISTRNEFYEKFSQCPIPPKELLSNLGLFLNRQTLSRIIYMHDLYQKIINVNGIVVEFGVRWGQNLSLFSSFRGMYEPYNYYRKIVGFDTFSGFSSISNKDGKNEIISKGAFGVTQDYEEYLNAVMSCHEQGSPVNHIKKYELIKGDATVTLEKYLQDNPQTIIALAYFDFDLYEPTKKCLELIWPYITKGTVIGFDELNDPTFPGETIALKEVFGLDKYSIRRSPIDSGPSYVVVE